MSPLQIAESYRKLLEKKLSRTTVHHVAVLLRQALDAAVKHGLITQNPASQTDIPPRDTKTRPVLTAEQFHAFIEDAKQTAPEYLWPLYLTAAGTGMRLEELLGLPESDLDLEVGLLHVRQTLKRPGRTPRFGKPKTDRSRRTVTLPLEVVDALRNSVAGRSSRN